MHVVLHSSLPSCLHVLYVLHHEKLQSTSDISKPCCRIFEQRFSHPWKMVEEFNFSAFNIGLCESVFATLFAWIFLKTDKIYLHAYSFSPTKYICMHLFACRFVSRVTGFVMHDFLLFAMENLTLHVREINSIVPR